MGTGALLFSRKGNLGSTVLRRKKLVHLYWCTTVFRHSTVFRRMVFYWSQEKETGALLFQEKETGALLFQEKETGALLFQEKGPGALLFSGERNWCTAVLRIGEGKMFSIIFKKREHEHSCYQRRKLVLYCFRRRKLVLYCFRRRDLVLYCSREKGDGAVLIGFIGLIYIKPKSLSG